jgi:hypothetical protein
MSSTFLGCDNTTVPDRATLLASLESAALDDGILGPNEVVSLGFEVEGKPADKPKVKTMVVLTVCQSGDGDSLPFLHDDFLDYRSFSFKNFTGSVEMQVVKIPKDVIDLTGDNSSDEDDTVDKVADKVDDKVVDKVEQKVEHKVDANVDKYNKTSKDHENKTPNKPSCTVPRGTNGCFSPFSDSSEIEQQVESEVDSDLDCEFEDTQPTWY